MEYVSRSAICDVCDSNHNFRMQNDRGEHIALDCVETLMQVNYSWGEGGTRMHNSCCLLC